MAVQMTITGEDEVDFRRQLMRLAAPYLENFVEADGLDPEPEATEPPSAADIAAYATAVAAEAQAPTPAPEPKKGGRPKGSTNKPKANGNGAEPPPQTEAQPENGAVIELLSLSEQIQIITDAAHDAPDKFKPLLAPLRDKLGVQFVSKALEKDRLVLQMFINEHGLAV